MRNARCFRLAFVVALGVLTASCWPKPDKPFQPFPTGQGWVDHTRPNCGAGYAAFETYAEQHAWGLSGSEALQPTTVDADPTKPTLWAKVKVYALEGSGDLYVFTRFGHPAHPAVLIKSLVMTSEGASWSVVGCPWGPRAAYRRFATASRMLTDAFMGEIEQTPPFGGIAYPLGQSPAENEEVHVRDAAQAVGAVADRAVALKADQRFMTTLYAFTQKDTGMAALNLTWIKEPPAGADRYAIIDAARVDYQSGEGPRATAAWCGGPEAARTPIFCAAAAKETATWREYWAAGAK